MTMQQPLSDLIELARERVDQAGQAFHDASDRLDSMERFSDLDGGTVLFTITEVENGDYINYLGQIVDCAENTVLYACQFYYDDWEKKQDLFDRLLINYAEWRFGL